MQQIFMNVSIIIRFFLSSLLPCLFSISIFRKHKFEKGDFKLFLFQKD